MGFLKPTKWKIFATFFIPVYFTYTVQYAMVMPPQKGIWYQIVFYPVPLMVLYPYNLYHHIHAVSAYPVFSLGKQCLHFSLNYIFPVAINYIMVCLFLSLCKKMRNR